METIFFSNGDKFDFIIDQVKRVRKMMMEFNIDQGVLIQNRRKARH